MNAASRMLIPRKIKALPLLLAERATDRATERERKAQRYGRAQRNGLRDPHPTKPPKPPRRVSSVTGPPPYAARFGPSWARRSEHRGHPDRSIPEIDLQRSPSRSRVYSLRSERGDARHQGRAREATG